MENYTQEQVDEMCTMHEAWLKDRSAGKRADFSGASLRGLSLKGRNLRLVNFKNADMTGALMQFANLGGADLEGANLTFVRAANARFDDCTADFASFDEARLTCASFVGASLQRASFRDAIINFVTFSEADLRRADFVDAVTGCTKFATANIDFAAFNSGIAGDCFDDKQIAECAYQLCSAVLGGHTNSPEVKETVRKILSLANRANSVKAFGPVQEYMNGQYMTAKEDK